MNRLKKAWRVLWGEDLGTEYPYKFVQLMYFRDEVLALTGDGDIYRISCHGMYDEPAITLWFENPVRPW